MQVTEVKLGTIYEVLIDHRRHYYVHYEYCGIKFRTAASLDKSLMRDFVCATVAEIKRCGGKDFTLCPRCQGYVFHAVGARCVGSCGCGMSIELVGNGRTGIARSFSAPGVYY